MLSTLVSFGYAVRNKTNKLTISLNSVFSYTLHLQLESLCFRCAHWAPWALCGIVNVLATNTVANEAESVHLALISDRVYTVSNSVVLHKQWVGLPPRHRQYVWFESLKLSCALFNYINRSVWWIYFGENLNKPLHSKRFGSLTRIDGGRLSFKATGTESGMEICDRTKIRTKMSSSIAVRRFSSRF